MAPILLLAFITCVYTQQVVRLDTVQYNELTAQLTQSELTAQLILAELQVHTTQLAQNSLDNEELIEYANSELAISQAILDILQATQIIQMDELEQAIETNSVQFPNLRQAIVDEILEMIAALGVQSGILTSQTNTLVGSDQAQTQEIVASVDACTSFWSTEFALVRGKFAEFETVGMNFLVEEFVGAMTGEFEGECFCLGAGELVGEFEYETMVGDMHVLCTNCEL